jgi:hypothetical protein
LIGGRLETSTDPGVVSTVPPGVLALLIVNPPVTKTWNELIDEFPLGVSFLITAVISVVLPAAIVVGIVKLKIFCGAAKLGTIVMAMTIATTAPTIVPRLPNLLRNLARICSLPFGNVSARARCRPNGPRNVGRLAVTRQVAERSFMGCSRLRRCHRTGR